MKKYFNGPSMLCALLAFILFLVAACAAWYLTVGEFVTAQMALFYVVLSLLGALALLLHLHWFALFFYAGCILGWMSGRFVGSLEGDFAPTAGIICTFFLIFVFAFIGAALEWKSWQRRRRRDEARREREQRADEERQRKVIAEQAAKVEAKKTKAEQSCSDEDILSHT